MGIRLESRIVSLLVQHQRNCDPLVAGVKWEFLPGNVIADAAHRFLSIDTRYQLRWKVARDVASARENGVVPRRFSIVNTGKFGLNWFSFGFYRLLHRKEGGRPWHPTRN